MVAGWMRPRGLAGAAGFAAPLLAGTSVRASTTKIVLGVNSGAWIITSSPDWRAEVSGYAPYTAVGCRSYRDTAFSAGPQTDPNCPTVFPGEQNTKPVASIRPDPTVLLNPNHQNYPGLVQALKDLILDGMRRASSNYPGGQYFAGTPQLTVWHEAGSFYTDATKWGKYGVIRGTQTPINGTYLSAEQIVRSMHVQMQTLCNQVANDPANAGLTRVEYGCIIYGDIDKMASNTDMTQNFVPGVAGHLSQYPLDWYGIDVYYEDDTAYGSTTNTHGNLDTLTKVSNYMGGFATMAQSRVGSGALRINVCETNANVNDDAARPGFFEHLAQWLSSNGGYRMLTFFPTDKAGNHSVTWQHVAQAGTNDNTIDALRYIQSTYG